MGSDSYWQTIKPIVSKTLKENLRNNNVVFGCKGVVVGVRTVGRHGHVILKSQHVTSLTIQ